METLPCKNITLTLDRPLVMGVLNVTPDSFSDGGEFFTSEAAIAHAKKMAEEGTDIIDIGGESTRPGSVRISAQEELSRVIPVIDVLLKELNIPLSIDTTKPEVAEECLRRGVHILNDVTGLRNKEMVRVAATYNVPTIVMHMQGTLETMQIHPSYTNVVEDIKIYLGKQAQKAKEAGITYIIIDPGIGFGKTLEHNLAIIKHLQEFKTLGYPLLIGPSRKTFIGKILNAEPDNRLEGTLAAVTACVLNGADIIRVHDVKTCKRAIQIAHAIRNQE